MTIADHLPVSIYKAAGQMQSNLNVLFSETLPRLVSVLAVYGTVYRNSEILGKKSDGVVLD